MLNPGYTLREIARLTAAEIHGPPDRQVRQLVFDTRKFTPGAEGAMFLALRGSQRDGHQFLARAWALGITNFWVSDRAALEQLPVSGASAWAALVSPDPLLGLQRWAGIHRRQFAGPVVALTGSNGKTIVKEWLAALLASRYTVAKSPMSFNSQLGVPLSVLDLASHHTLGLFEAGISQPGEMQVLAELLQPDIGLLTHFGDAHAENFQTDAEKLSEKCRLFRGCRLVLATADDPRIRPALQAFPHKTVGQAADATYRVRDILFREDRWHFSLEAGQDTHHFQFPQAGTAALENILLALVASRELGIDWPTLQQGILALHPVRMRTEWITDAPDLTIINDTWNADEASVRNALSLLFQQPEPRRLILSDIEDQGPRQAALQTELAKLALGQLPATAVCLVGPVFQSLHTLQQTYPGLKVYPDREALMRDLEPAVYRYSTVLLKGARRFGLEKLVPFLSRQVHATHFSFNLQALRANLHTLRTGLPPGTRVMAMVKASAYGSGSWQVAHALEQEGVDYLAVAFPNEGIVLRQKGIRTPILVLNADPESLPTLMVWTLEPAVWSFRMLDACRALANAPSLSRRLPIHLEFDTGMSRLGFMPEELPAVLSALEGGEALLEVRSVFTHLAEADAAEAEAFTREQLDRFAQVAAAIRERFPQVLGHALNTAGVLQFPEAAGDLVRLGIGLYGVAPTDAAAPAELVETGSLLTTISQIHTYPAGQTVGYSRSETLSRPSRIATLPIGYADGLPLRLSNGRYSVGIRGRRCPIMGRVCMDMTMIDVTGVPEAREGDPVLIFGSLEDDFISLWELARAAETIPYEILSGLSARIRRLYFDE